MVTYWVTGYKSQSCNENNSKIPALAVLNG